jgi:hypothetical protein
MGKAARKIAARFTLQQKGREGLARWIRKGTTRALAISDPLVQAVEFILRTHGMRGMA